MLVRGKTEALLMEVLKNHEQAYPGTGVAHGGETDEFGGESRMLEYVIGVSQDGLSLCWHFNNKNSESVFNIGKQRLLKLRHWKSGTYSKNLMNTVRSRLIDMAQMTRHVDGTFGGNRGSGDSVRDLKFTVWEFFTELHCCLMYPLRSLLNCAKRLAQSSLQWSNVLDGVLQIKSLSQQ